MRRVAVAMECWCCSGQVTGHDNRPHSEQDHVGGDWLHSRKVVGTCMVLCRHFIRLVAFCMETFSHMQPHKTQVHIFSV